VIAELIILGIGVGVVGFLLKLLVEVFFPNWYNKLVDRIRNLLRLPEDGIFFFFRIQRAENPPNLNNPHNHISNNSKKVDINEATLAQLQDVPGIGLKIAQIIEQNRRYKSIEELLKLPYIGEVKLNKIRDYLIVNSIQSSETESL
jgi:competence ComEA-like helix-hairpin-helix protein